MKSLFVSDSPTEDPMLSGAFLLRSKRDPFHLVGRWCGPYCDSPAVDLWALYVTEALITAEGDESLQTLIRTMWNVAEVMQ
jgi:hypothetical protein